MALTGSTNEQKIWNYLYAWLGNAYGTAGLMGNLFAESALLPNNLQNTFEKKLGYSDTTYTTAVDTGAYSNFVKDSAGYGLAQWTYWSRKQALLSYAQAKGKSIGDLEMQLNFLTKELKESYSSVVSALKSAASVTAASDIVLTKFEMPADQSSTHKKLRASYGQTYYDKYAKAAGSASSTASSGKKTKAIEALISIASAEIGYLEKNSSANLDNKTAGAGSGNYTKYWRDLYPAFQGQAWCAIFVTWCMVQAFGKAVTSSLLQHYPYTYVPTLAAKTSNTEPKRGDVVCFYRNGTFTHTGLVTDVVGSTIKTIEGNTSGGSTIIANGGGVCAKTYNLSNLSGTRFFRPDYSKVGTISTTASTSTSSSVSSSATSTKSYLSKGDKGDAVKKMQTMLIACGYSCGSYGADGDFGSATDAALRKLQKDYGLGVDGKYGPVSKAKLEALYTAATSKKSVEAVAKEVLAGKWGNGSARKTALEKAGYDYSAVQAKVNELIG